MLELTAVPVNDTQKRIMVDGVTVAWAYRGSWDRGSKHYWFLCWSTIFRYSATEGSLNHVKQVCINRIKKDNGMMNKSC